MRNARGRTTAVGRVALVTCLAFVLASVHGAEAQPSSYPKKVSLDGPWSYRALAHTTLKADGSIIEGSSDLPAPGRYELFLTLRERNQTLSENSYEVTVTE